MSTIIELALVAAILYPGVSRWHARRDRRRRWKP